MVRIKKKIPCKNWKQPELLFISKNLLQIFAASQREAIFVRSISKHGCPESFCTIHKNKLRRLGGQEISLVTGHREQNRHFFNNIFHQYLNQLIFVIHCYRRCIYSINFTPFGQLYSPHINY